MKKILVIAVGLMSLLGVLSSCDDKSEFIETEEFVPYCYLVKDATTIQIVGYKSLVIEEKEKTDWQLFVPFSLDFLGSKPLELEETEFELFDYMEKNSAQIDVSTNMTDKPFEQDISFAVGGLLQSYTYMGEEQKLECFSPLMVKLEVVVCLPEHSPAVVHPKSKVAYEHAVEAASVMLARNDTFPSLRIFANDPSGLVTEIFAYMFNTVVRCPVTKIENREASITVVITSGRKVVYQKSYPMNEFLNQNKFVSDSTSPILCFGTSRIMVEEYAKNKERGTGRLSEDDVKIIKAEAMIAARGEHEATIRDLNSKLQEATNRNLEFQGRMQLMQFKMAEQENQLSVLNSQINGYKAVFANHEQVAALSRSAMQTDIAREKTKQARISTNTEEIKQSEVIWKLAGGAAIALVTAVITAYLKDQK